MDVAEAAAQGVGNHVGGVAVFSEHDYGGFFVFEGVDSLGVFWVGVASRVLFSYVCVGEGVSAPGSVAAEGACFYADVDPEAFDQV